MGSGKLINNVTPLCWVLSFICRFLFAAFLCTFLQDILMLLFCQVFSSLEYILFCNLGV